MNESLVMERRTGFRIGLLIGLLLGAASSWIVPIVQWLEEL